jgi:glycine cleavage system aminomethyltransferase T
MNPPARLTALYHKHLALRGTMVESEGWLLPERYAGPEKEMEAALGSVGLFDCSASVKVDVKGDGGEVSGFLGEIVPGEKVAGRPGDVAIYPGSEGSMRYVCRLTDEHALLVFHPRRVPHRTSPLDPEIETAPNHKVYLTNVTSVLAGITLIGPAAPRVLRKLSSVDVSLEALPNPGCSEGGVAGIQCAMVRTEIRAGDRRVDSFDLYLGRGYAEYLWDAVSEAGREFKIAPVGTTACSSMLGLPPRTEVGAGQER